MKATKTLDLRVIGQAASLAVLLALGTIGGAQAGPKAGKGNGKPTDPDPTAPSIASIIGDAEAVCAEAASLTNPDGLALISTACGLMRNTDGYKDGKGYNCTQDPYPLEEPVVIYTGRNCNYNEDTMRRDAGSVVTELGDAFIGAPAEGDDPCPKLEQAATSIGSYLFTYGELTVEGEDRKLFDGANLGDDAQSIEWGIAAVYAAECVD